MKKRFYELKKILETGADYFILLGPRGNGKSYAVKKYVIDEYFKKGHHFAYIRRLKEETLSTYVTDYFADMFGEDGYIFKASKGKYNCVEVFRRKIYFAYNDGETITRGEQFGNMFCLSVAGLTKSLQFPKIVNMVYEEFVTDRHYLVNEPFTLMHFVSTILRRRKGKVFLIGNTISKVCPYYYEWCLDGVKNQETGSIDVYTYTTDEKDDNGKNIVVKIAVEMTAPVDDGNSGMFFGKVGKNISQGVYDFKDYPHLPNKRSDYSFIYEFGVEHIGFKFVCELLINNNNGGVILFVRPNTLERHIKRTITTVFSDDPFITTALDPTTFEVERLVIKAFECGKVCYANNMTGADFEAILNELGGVI